MLTATIRANDDILAIALEVGTAFPTHPRHQHLESPLIILKRRIERPALGGLNASALVSVIGGIVVLGSILVGHRIVVILYFVGLIVGVIPRLGG